MRVGRLSLGVCQAQTCQTNSLPHLRRAGMTHHTSGRYDLALDLFARLCVLSISSLPRHVWTIVRG